MIQSNLTLHNKAGKETQDEVINMQAILRPPQAANYIGVSLRTLYNIERHDPDFPRKIVFSPRCVGYRRESLNVWLEKKEAQ